MSSVEGVCEVGIGCGCAGDDGGNGDGVGDTSNNYSVENGKNGALNLPYLCLLQHIQICL